MSISTIHDVARGTDDEVTDVAAAVPDGHPDGVGSNDGLRAIRHRALGGLEPIWRDRRVNVALMVGAAAAWGLAAGWWTPRSPLTTSQAILSIMISLVVGMVAGLLSRSRWSLVVAPVAFAVAFELARADIDGPTVDAPSTSTYGFLAFFVGRGFHTLISLAPMAFGAIVGAGTARQLDTTRTLRTPRRRWTAVLRRTVAFIAALGLAGFTLALARPASTATVVDANGEEIPGSIAELTTVDSNGHHLALMIRGHSIDNPVMLFLAGGPGGSEMGAMRRHLAALEEHFTVVTWDQRGSGKSYTELDPTDSFTLTGAVDDTLVVTDYLRERFGRDRIYLTGQSWGTILGVLAVQQSPESFAAFIGTGQMVDPLDTDTIIYDDTLAWARANGNSGLVDQLEQIGPPPYVEMLNYETALSYEHEVYPYDHTGNSEGEGGFSENFFVSEYSLIDQVHLLGAFVDTFSVMYPQLQDVDLRRTATDFDVPVFFVQGAHEAAGRSEPFAQWYPMILAPSKDVVVLDTSGHRPLWEQPDEFVDYMVTTVLATTDPS